jgi:hypothetical protein
MKSTLIVEIVPTFYLKKIDSLEIYNKLINGDFKSIQKKNNLSSTYISNIKLYGNDSQDSTYTFNDNNNIKQIIVTSNNNIRNKCDWCLKEIKTNDIVIGVPISYKYDSGNHIFEMEGCCHSFECSFSYMKRFRGYHLSTYDPLYYNSENILRYFFHLCYPNDILMEACDPRIQNHIGGPLEDCNHVYYRLPSIVIKTAKGLYQK